MVGRHPPALVQQRHLAVEDAGGGGCGRGQDQQGSGHAALGASQAQSLRETRQGRDSSTGPWSAPRASCRTRSC